jgi:hypothetical protein
LDNWQDARARSWNQGDRFSVPDADGQAQPYRVMRNRMGGEEFYQGDVEQILRGG